MNVLVTGGAGFIGANLCQRLVADGAVDGVVALDDLSTGSAANLAPLGDAVELVVGSINDEALVRELVGRSHAVVHLAARPSVSRSIENPMATHRVNVDGTMTILEAARRSDPPQIVMASSSSVYGANPHLPKHEGLAPRPVSPYAASKLAGESYLLSYQACFAVPAVAFRFFNVFGPLQAPGHAYAAVVPAFVSAALRGAPIPIHGDGTQTRDFTYVGTVVEALTRTVTRRLAHPAPVNLAFGTRVSLLELLDLLEALLGHPLERQFLPTRAGDVRDSQAANDTLAELLPDVQPVRLQDGLAATLAWLRTALAT